MKLTADQIQLALTTAGVVVALLTFAKAVNEYRRQGTIKRIEFFLEARNRLKTNAKFQEIVFMLESDDPALRDVSIESKIEFVGFFEEIALLVTSRVIRQEIAEYMFGYYAMKTWESENFWLLNQRPERPLDKENEPYWFVFRQFIRTLVPIRDKLVAGHPSYRKYVL